MYDYIGTLLRMIVIVLIKLQLNEFLFFFTIEIIALDGQSVKILLTSNCLSV